MSTKALENPPKPTSIFFVSMDDSPYKEAWFTPYSIQHFLIGLITFPIFKILEISNPLNLILANLLHIVYESKDILLTYKVRKFNGRYLNFNSVRNTIGDHFVFTLGQIIGWYMFHLDITPHLFQAVLVLMYVTQIALYITKSD